MNDNHISAVQYFGHIENINIIAKAIDTYFREIRLGSIKNNLEENNE